MSGVRRQHAFQSRSSASGSVQPSAGSSVSAVRVRKPVQLEGVAVQDEVRRSPALRVERLEKQRELPSPAEVLLDAPLPGRVPAEAHVQIGDDRDQPG